MGTTIFLKGSRFGSTWLERYTVPKEGTLKLKSAPTLSQISGFQKIAWDSNFDLLLGYLRG
jgi:hypothetical protein